MGNSFAKGISCVLAFCLSMWCVPAAAWAGESEPDGGVTSAEVAPGVSEAPDWSVADGPVSTGNGLSASEFALFEDGASGEPNVATDQIIAPDGEGCAREHEGIDSQAIASAPNEFASTQIEEGFYTIHSAIDASFALDVSGGSSSSGANVQLWTGNDSAAQTWYVGKNDDGTYSIESLCSGLFLDVQWASRDAGTNVWQYSASNTPAQKWKIIDRMEIAKRFDDQKQGDKASCASAGKAEDSGDISGEAPSAVDGTSATYMLLSECNGLALDVSAANASDGSNIQCYTPNATAAQGFTFQKADALPGGIYAIKAFSDQRKMVEMKWGLRTDGAQADLYDWNGSPAQRWKIAKDSGGYYSFESVCSGLMLTSAAVPGGAATQTKSIDSAADGTQKWALSGNPAGGFRLISKATGLALDLKGGDAYNGNSIQVFPENGSSAQGFIFKQPSTFVSDGYYTIDFWAASYYGDKTGNAKRLDVAGASREAGANVQLFTGNGTRAQAFHIVSNGDGTYALDIPFSRKTLDVRYGGMAPGTNVQQWNRNGSDGQKWRIEYDGAGAVRIVSVLNGLPLQVAGSSAVDGANIELGAGRGGVQQRFMLTPTTYVPEDFEDHIAHFSTVSTNTINGWYNMSRALSNFDGMVVWPGETVSFFDTCGPCGAAEGYLIAGVVGGSGYGGGICQASTTLYGAVVRAGLTIVERQNHTTPSTYVPIGQDAMVNWGTSDFRFRNDWDFPVKIVVDNYDRTLNCDIWGIQPDWYDYIDVSSWWTGSNTASAQREYYKNDQVVATSALPDSWYW